MALASFLGVAKVATGNTQPTTLGYSKHYSFTIEVAKAGGIPTQCQ